MIDHSRIKRILIVRTDRIGDVVLSTPVARILRKTFPKAFIAFMTGPKTRDILVGNPHIDESIVYDKFEQHKSWWQTIRFAFRLRRRAFDLAFILHSTNRVIWVTTLAGIRHRVGYARRLGFLLTERLPYTKPEGKKHEVSYNFDLLRHVGIEGSTRKLSWTVLPSEEAAIARRLEEEGIGRGERLIAIHPDASAASKRWPAPKFIELCASLAQGGERRVILVAAEGGEGLTHQIASQLGSSVINWGGRLVLRELAALFKRCEYVISNDSGPVHVSTAVGTPVVSIFGRKLPGLGATRWGPVGERDIVLQKDPGCDPCIPDPCPIQLECLESLSVGEVLAAARTLEVRHV